MLFVSMYNQIKDKKEIRGMEAKIPPIRDDRFEISEMRTTITAVMIILKI